MATTRRRTAGIHLDGGVATLVLVATPDTTPTVTAVRQVQGFTEAEALQRALPLIEPGTPVRVVFSTDGVAAAPVDLTAAMLDRDGFATAARRALTHLHPTAAIAGVLPDVSAVHAGQIATGLAVAAPADVVAGLYQHLAHVPAAEVTTCAAAAGALDGLHLALRRTTSELTWVREGMPVVSTILAAGGADQVTSHLRDDTVATAAAMVGRGHDPVTAAVVGAWLARVVAEAALTVDQWAIAGHPVGREVLVHGKAAGAAALDDLLTSVGLVKHPHPLVALPFEAPLDAVDAYYAAVSAATRTPLAAFYDPAHPHTADTGARTARTRRTRRARPPRQGGRAAQRAEGTVAPGRKAPRPRDQVRRRQRATAAVVLVALTAAAVGYTSWLRVAAVTDLERAQALLSGPAADPAARRDVDAARLRSLDEAAAATTRIAAALLTQQSSGPPTRTRIVAAPARATGGVTVTVTPRPADTGQLVALLAAAGITVTTSPGPGPALTVHVRGPLVAPPARSAP